MESPLFCTPAASPESNILRRMMKRRTQLSSDAVKPTLFISHASKTTYPNIDNTLSPTARSSSSLSTSTSSGESCTAFLAAPASSRGSEV
jgi:hypothetical protein